LEIGRNIFQVIAKYPSFMLCYVIYIAKRLLSFIHTSHLFSFNPNFSDFADLFNLGLRFLDSQVRGFVHLGSGPSPMVGQLNSVQPDKILWHSEPNLTRSHRVMSEISNLDFYPILDPPHLCKGQEHVLGLRNLELISCQVPSK